MVVQRAYIAPIAVSPHEGRAIPSHDAGKNRVLPPLDKEPHLARKLLPARELEARVGDFVAAYYNDQRYHESLDNLTPADVYFGGGQRILERRDVIKRQTLDDRRQRNLQSAA